MSLSALLIFLPVYALAVASPGPAVAAVVARAARFGVARTVPLIGGIVIGDMVWLTCVVLGLSAVARSFEGVTLVIRYLGAAYLLYLAARLWTAPAVPSEPPPQTLGEGARLLLGGLSLTLGNPKVMVFFLAILPGVVDVESVGPLAYAALIGCIAVVLGTTMLAYAAVAARAGRLLAAPQYLKLVNRTTGAVMAGAAAAIVARA